MWCIGRARRLGPTRKPQTKGDFAKHLGIEVLNVGGWQTHGDAALKTYCDFLLMTATRLIPPKSRNECAKLRRNHLTSIWSPPLVRTLRILLLQDLDR